MNSGLPKSVTLIRHAESGYNVLQKKKEGDAFYQKFVLSYDRSFTSRRTRDLADKVIRTWAPAWSDAETPLTQHGKEQAIEAGKVLFQSEMLEPDIILVSPYLRTRETLIGIKEGWESERSSSALPVRNLYQVETHFVDLLREQSYGIGILYNDWRAFQTKNPEQKALRDLNGPYWYRYPQGESYADVRDRMHIFERDVLRSYEGKNVFIVSHHRTILLYVAHVLGLSPDETLSLDERKKPHNCARTTLVNEQGRLVLKHYNQPLL